MSPREFARKMGVCVVITGPSGAGKTTIVTEMIKRNPDASRLVTVTTREPRPGEVDGVDYHFVTKEEFADRRGQGEFLEWAQTYGDLYGSSRRVLAKQRMESGLVFATVDVKGAQEYRKQVVGAILVMFKASLATLKERLGQRPGVTPEKMARRLAEAEKEMAFAPRCDIVLDCEGSVEEIVASLRKQLEKAVP